MNNEPTYLNKILNGINSSLNIANKALPIYNQTKPIIKTITNTYKKIKSNKNELTNILKYIKLSDNINKENVVINTKKIGKEKYYNTNNPKFFI